jgi:hypothetical protein
LTARLLLDLSHASDSSRSCARVMIRRGLRRRWPPRNTKVLQRLKVRTPAEMSCYFGGATILSRRVGGTHACNFGSGEARRQFGYGSCGSHRNVGKNTNVEPYARTPDQAPLQRVVYWRCCRSLDAPSAGKRRGVVVGHYRHLATVVLGSLYHQCDIDRRLILGYAGTRSHFATSSAATGSTHAGRELRQLLERV